MCEKGCQNGVPKGALGAPFFYNIDFLLGDLLTKKMGMAFEIFGEILGGRTCIFIGVLGWSIDVSIFTEIKTLVDFGYHVGIVLGGVGATLGNKNTYRNRAESLCFLRETLGGPRLRGYTQRKVTVQSAAAVNSYQVPYLLTCKQL